MGRGRRDEIVEIGIVDDRGQIIMDRLVRPIERKTWKSAQKVHGISPDDVADAPTLDAIQDELLAAIRGKNVAIYNAPFDLRFMPSSLADEARSYVCVMNLFRKIHSGRYRLKDALEWAGISQAISHRAIHDAMGTLGIWNERNTPAWEANLSGLCAAPFTYRCDGMKYEAQSFIWSRRFMRSSRSPSFQMIAAQKTTSTIRSESLVISINH